MEEQKRDLEEAVHAAEQEAVMRANADLYNTRVSGGKAQLPTNARWERSKELALREGDGETAEQLDVLDRLPISASAKVDLFNELVGGTPVKRKHEIPKPGSLHLRPGSHAQPLRAEPGSRTRPGDDVTVRRKKTATIVAGAKTRRVVRSRGGQLVGAGNRFQGD